MPQTYRDYPVMECALAVFHGGKLESGHERATAGDIITVREALGYIGRAEGHIFLWLQLYGLDVDDMLALGGWLEIDGGAIPGSGAIYDKRRYSIPFPRLAQIVPGFNMGQARNPGVVYQPFFLLDEETGGFLATIQAPLSVQGLVFDKHTRQYL